MASAQQYTNITIYSQRYSVQLTFVLHVYSYIAGQWSLDLLIVTPPSSLVLTMTTLLPSKLLAIATAPVHRSGSLSIQYLTVPFNIVFIIIALIVVVAPK